MHTRKKNIKKRTEAKPQLVVYRPWVTSSVFWKRKNLFRAEVKTRSPPVTLSQRNTLNHMVAARGLVRVVSGTWVAQRSQFICFYKFHVVPPLEQPDKLRYPKSKLPERISLGSHDRPWERKRNPRKMEHQPGGGEDTNERRTSCCFRAAAAEWNVQKWTSWLRHRTTRQDQGEGGLQRVWHPCHQCHRCGAFLGTVGWDNSQ